MVTAQIEQKWRRELRRANAHGLNNEARVSVHEAGHSLCHWLLPGAERFMRCTVVPTAEFDGATFTHPKDVFSLSELKTEMVCLYGGKRAEMLFFDESIGHEGSDDLVVEGHAKKIVAKRRHRGRMLRSRQRREVAQLLAEAERTCQTLLRYRKCALQKIALELYARKTLKYRDMRRILKKGQATRRRGHGVNSRSSSVESNELEFDDIEGGVKYTLVVKQSNASGAAMEKLVSSSLDAHLAQTSLVAETSSPGVVYSVDHVYPSLQSVVMSLDGTSIADLLVVMAVLYPDIGTFDDKFRALHERFVHLATDGQLIYVLRHFDNNDQAENFLDAVSLPGYGVELAIKSTEYNKSINDSNEQKTEGAGNGVHGFNFSRLRSLVQTKVRQSFRDEVAQNQKRWAEELELSEDESASDSIAAADASCWLTVWWTVGDPDTADGRKLLSNALKGLTKSNVVMRMAVLYNGKNDSKSVSVLVDVLPHGLSSATAKQSLNKLLASDEIIAEVKKISAESVLDRIGGHSVNLADLEDERRRPVLEFTAIVASLSRVAQKLAPVLQTLLEKGFLSTMASHYGFDYRLIEYKWSRWLHQQAEKQRVMRGYKILFLDDVLFPLDVKKIIFVDADQIVWMDMPKLMEYDLDGAAYGSGRKSLDGFCFWKSGYWAQHLAGRKYRFSALYVVDLVKFRKIAAGDRLRGQCQGLSSDPNSLPTLEQELPKNMTKEPMLNLLLWATGVENL